MKNKLLLLTLPALLLACNSGTTVSGTPTPTPTTAPGTPYAYFLYTGGSPGTDSYTQCVATADGIESSTCSTYVLESSLGAQTISFKDNYAYIANSNLFSSYRQCQVNESGIESSTCTTINLGPTDLKYIYQMAFNSSYAFIEYSDGYAQCSYSESGLIESTSCIFHTPSQITDAQGLAINANYAYFAANNTNSGNPYFTQCPISNGSIESSNCALVTLPSSPDKAQGVLLYGSYAYFANGGSTGSYTQCPVGSDNSIISGSCEVYIPSGNGALHNAQQVAIYESYAYFANDNGATSYYTQCLVTANGIESQSCTNYTPGAYESGDMRGISFWPPLTN